MNDLFRRVAVRTSTLAGTAGAFLGALAIIIVWLITGPLFHFSDTWQLVINTGTTIVTFLMVFLIQNAQNRESAVVQLKLDELIRSTKTAQNAMIDIEHLSDEQLQTLQESFRRLAEHDVAKLEPVVDQVEEELEEREEEGKK